MPLFKLAGSTKNPSRYAAYVSSKLDGTEEKSDVESRLLFYINTADDNLDDPANIFPKTMFLLSMDFGLLTAFLTTIVPDFNCLYVSWLGWCKRIL